MTVSNLPTRSLVKVQYRYLIADLKNNEIISDLPLKGVSYSNILSDVGEFAGTIQINKSTKVFNIKKTVLPGKTAVYVLRNGLPIWGGIIWKISYSAPTRSLRVDANTFESYFYRRFQRQNKSWANADQLQIARDIANQVAGDLGIIVGGGSSPRVRSRSVYKYEYKTIGEELQQLSDLIDGFDWNITLSPAPGNKVTKTLQFFYPDRGATKANTKIAFEYPGSIESFTYTQDAERGATRMWAIGAGESEEQIERSATDISGNWPILEESYSYKTVVNGTTLQSHADSDLRRLRAPVEIVEAIVRANVEPFLGTYAPGDWARFSFQDDFFDPRETKFMRIIGYNVSVADDGIERVRLTLNTEREELA
jgi:hypothetical protein